MKFCRTNIFVFLLLIDVTRSLGLWDYYKKRTFQCVPIKEKLCLGLGYNYTTSPNIMGDDNQEEASRRFLEFKPLIGYQYSEKFRFFLCTLFFPMCTEEVNVGIPACRPMCEEMKREKGPIMKTFGFEWSDSIDCSQLPWKSVEDHLCIPHPSYERNEEEPFPEPELEEEEETIFYPSLSADSNLPLSDEEFIIPSVEIPESNKETNENEQLPINPPIALDSLDLEIYPIIPSAPKIIDEAYFVENDNIEPPDVDPPLLEINPTPPLLQNKCENPDKFFYLESTKKCVPRCGRGMDVMFSKTDKFNAFLVVTICASLCFVSTAITMATFFIDSKRFRYPERPIMFLSLCYNVYAVGYILRSLKGPDSPISCAHNTTMELQHLIVAGHKDTSCYASFFLLYFFGMAASSWWVILNVTFVLSAGFKWGHEAIERYGTYFHCLAWSFPLFQTIAALLLAKIDGNELTGTCYVGNLDESSLMYFVIIPLTLYLLIGSVALVLGLCYLFKILRLMQHQNIAQASSLEKLISKIGIFSAFYAISTACVLAANFFQYQHLDHWMTEAQNTPCYQTSPENTKYFPSSHQRTLQDTLSEPWNEMGQKAEFKTNLKRNTGYLNDDYNTDFLLYKREVNSYVSKSSSSEKTLGQDKFEKTCHLKDSIPFYLIYFCKISMSLLPGIISVIWVLSTKTINSWSKFFKQCCCSRKEKKQRKGYIEENPMLFQNSREIAASSSEENLYNNMTNSEEGTYSLMTNPHHDLHRLNYAPLFGKATTQCVCSQDIRYNPKQKLKPNCIVAPQCLEENEQQILKDSDDDVFVDSHHYLPKGPNSHPCSTPHMHHYERATKIQTKNHQRLKIAPGRVNSRCDEPSYASIIRHVPHQSLVNEYVANHCVVPVFGRNSAKSSIGCVNNS